MAQDDVLHRHEDARSGGMHDEPRIVKDRESARAGDRHRENLYALVIGVAVVIGIFVALYALEIF